MIQTAIITGASGSIGGAIARRFSKAGYSLVLTGYQSKENLERTKKLCLEDAKQKKITLHTMCGDLSDPKIAENQMQEALQILGHVDILVNCAGISHIGLFHDMSNDEWKKMIDTNLSSIFYCCRSITPSMIHKKRGRILNISSVWGNVGASCEAAYSAAKGGVNTFTKALAKELAPSGIAVNALSCGIIDTPMNQCFSKEDLDAICEEIPAGRMGTPEESAELVFLLSQAPTYMTGQIITMDGGWC